MLDLADYMMHHWLLVTFFVLKQSHTCACNMCRFEPRHHLAVQAD